MKRQLTATTIVLALSLVFASSAAGAVSFSFSEAQHEEATINRGDELASYSVKIKNSGTEATSGAIKLSIALPVGAKLAAGVGSGWNCQMSAQTCTSSNAVAPEAEYPQLKLQVWLYPMEAPDVVTATFTASEGGALADAVASDSFTFGPETPFEIVDFTAAAEDEAEVDYTQAGGHPFAATSSFGVTTYASAQKGQVERAPVESLRDLYFELPAGFVGNPEAAEICAVSQVTASSCPEAAAVGGVNLDLGEFKNQQRVLFRVIPEAGYPAAFAFRPVALSPVTVVLRAKVRSNGDYGVTAVAPLPPQTPEFTRLNFARLCSYGAESEDQGQNGLAFISCRAPGEPGAREVPFLTNSTKCAGEAPITRAHIDSFQSPGRKDAEDFPDLSDPNWKSAETKAPQNGGCAALTEAWVEPAPKGPSFTFLPDTKAAATPAAYSAALHFPQEGLLEFGGLGSAHLKDTTVTLPKGIALNPSAAGGLGACSSAQIGLVGTGFPAPNPIHFNATSAGCPANSKIGNAEVTTPILAKALRGSVYLAAQEDNPFKSKFAIYLVIEDEETGITAKLAGKVEPSNSEEGRITTTFANNPQVPIEDVKLDFFGGPRASLANPDVCGSYGVATKLTPWSAVNPDNPAATEIATPGNTVTIDSGPGGGACATSKGGRPFGVNLEAGSSNLIGGATTPFTLRLTRADGNQEFSQVNVTTPPGFAAVLKGLATCGDAALAVAAAGGRTGAQELASPSCPPGSRVGSTTIGAGVGSHPFYVKTGKVYLTGPYKGAPISFTFIVPAVAGPFDLGVQVVRTALYVDPQTAQVTAKSDPIPQILDGVPLQIRDIRVDLDRQGFALNPTNCAAMAITSQVTGASGAVANLSNRFQVGGCDALKFKPNLKLQLHGGTKRGAYQRLQATYTAKPGEANASRIAVTLPHSAFLAQEHIRTICTRVQFAADACPKGSIYGHVTALTQILDEPLTGPIYLRSSSNPLPDLVMALRGPDSRPIKAEVAGRIDSKDGGIRNTFELVPDVPLAKVVVSFQGGRKSLIVNSRDLCKGAKQRAVVRLNAQNGTARNFKAVVQNDCGKKK